jgi:hypothetical protein
MPEAGSAAGALLAVAVRSGNAAIGTAQLDDGVACRDTGSPPFGQP